MADPSFNNTGSMSVGGAFVVGNGNTVDSRSEAPSRAAENAELMSLLRQIQQTALVTRLPGSVITEVVSGAVDAQRSLTSGDLAQVGSGLLRGYTALSAADPANQNTQLWQMMENAARMAFALEG